MRELKIQQLRYVLTVIEEGGFHAAAKRVHRSQPALSMAIRELEQRLGQEIFERGGKSRLTPFGESCLPRFRDLVGQHDRLAKAIALEAEGRQGRVDVATVPSVAIRIMPSILAEFIACYPELNVSLHDENAENVCRMVAQGEVEIGISSLWHASDGLAYTRLFEDKIGVVCRQDHVLAGRSSLGWKDLKGNRLIGNGTSRLLANTAASGLVDQSALYISNMISLIAMLEAGAGITTLPRLAFPEQSASLCFIPLHDPEVVRSIGLVKVADRTLAPAAQAMEKFVLERLRNGTVA